jgi:hypothetical protein
MVKFADGINSLWIIRCKPGIQELLVLDVRAWYRLGKGTSGAVRAGTSTCQAVREAD